MSGLQHIAPVVAGVLIAALVIVWIINYANYVLSNPYTPPRRKGPPRYLEIKIPFTGHYVEEPDGWIGAKPGQHRRRTAATEELQRLLQGQAFDEVLPDPPPTAPIDLNTETAGVRVKTLKPESGDLTVIEEDGGTGIFEWE